MLGGCWVPHWVEAMNSMACMKSLLAFISYELADPCGIHASKLDATACTSAFP